MAGMKIIDARSGREIKAGETIAYPDGESIRLDSYRPGILAADAVVTSTTRNLSGRLETATAVVPLVVRWTHPNYFLQHVAFLPT